MTLREKQCLFSTMVTGLLSFAISRDYEVTLGDAYRDPRVPCGHPDSLHKLRLAIDLNLFKDGKYLTRTEDHVELGTYWESIGGIWGGRWVDGNHYSYSHDGRK
jgi:hypothetical protein